MKRHGRHRGISVGTVLMLLVTVLVAGGLAFVLPRLRGTTDAKINTGQVLEALRLTGSPPLATEDIPIRVEAVTTPEPTGAVQGSMPAITPEVTEAPVLQQAASALTVTFGGTITVDSSIRKSVYFSDAKAYDFSEIFPLLTASAASDYLAVSIDNIVDDSLKVSDTVTVSAALTMLRQLNVNGAAVAWPSCLDKGTSGFAATTGALSSAGIVALGTVSNGQTDAVRIPCGERHVALLHYTDQLSSTGKRLLKKEGADSPVAVLDTETVQQDIQRARLNGADAVIVSLHWGQSGKTKPTKAQQQLAQALADAGADVIVGTGTNAVQPVEWLNTTRGQTLCCYSLGALLTSLRKNANVAGMLLHLTFMEEDGQLKLDRAAYTPTYIWRYQMDGRYWYRVLPSHTLAPDGMGDEQISAMTRALKTVQDVLKDSGLELRYRQ